MRRSDFDFRPAVAAKLAPGDIVSNKTKRAYRIVVAVGEHEVLVRAPNGGASTLAFSSIDGFWLKAIPKQADAFPQETLGLEPRT